jgi:hypothetical protein
MLKFPNFYFKKLNFNKNGAPTVIKNSINPAQARKQENS